MCVTIISLLHYIINHSNLIHEVIQYELCFCSFRTRIGLSAAGVILSLASLTFSIYSLHHPMVNFLMREHHFSRPVHSFPLSNPQSHPKSVSSHLQYDPSLICVYCFNSCQFFYLDIHLEFCFIYLHVLKLTRS